MKKHLIVPFGICALLVALSGFYLYRQYLLQVETKKELITRYMSDTKAKLEIIAARAKELPHIVKPIIGEGGLLNVDTVNLHADNIAQLKQFYTDNSYYIKGISVNDMYGDVFNLYRDKRDKTEEFIQDTYKSRVINVLRAETGIAAEKNSFSIVMPLYQGKALTGNVAININLDSLQRELFKPYLKKGDVWPTLILDEETALTHPFDGGWTLSDVKELCREVAERKSGFLTGRINGVKSSINVVTYYESLMIPEHYLGLAFSSDISPVIVSSIAAFAAAFIVFVLLATVAACVMNRTINKYTGELNQKEREIHLLQTIYGYAPIAFIVNRNGNFYTANNHFFKLFDGIAFRDDTGKVVFPFKFKPEFKEWDLCSFEKNGKPFCLGRRQIDMELDGVRYEIEAFWDVTEMEQRMKETVRSEITKSELLSRVSADVKKTLSNISDAVVILVQQLPEDSHIAYINKLTADLSVLIDDVQDYANIEAGRIMLDEMSFNLVDEIKKVTDLYQAETRRKGIELYAHVTGSATRNVVGDPQRFRQVLNELLSNAVKFTDEGFIRISLETVDLQGGKTLIKCSVEDTGRGMQRHKLKTLFSLDLRDKEEGDSIGLGVIITRKLVGFMGGTLRATSPSPISTDPSTPGMQFSFSMICYSDQPFDKNLDYSSIVSYNQVNTLIITSDTYQMQYLANFFNRKGINSDVFIYNKESSDLLINKLIIDRSRYQMVIISTSDSAVTFAIAGEINQQRLTGCCVYILIDALGQKGNYIKAKSLNMDYYFIKSDDPSIYDPILKTHFPNLSDTARSAADLHSDLNILVAENNELSQTVAKVIFKTLGCRVDLAQNALSLINQLNNKTYDVIFIDLKFPPSDGFEIAEMLRLKGYQLPVIAMTSTLTKENLKRIADSGMNGYVPKPLNPENIRHTLIKWFA